MQIEKLLTDNGRPLTDCFTRKTWAPSGQYVCDCECALLGIEHLLIKSRYPLGNARVERCNRRSSDVLATTRWPFCCGSTNTAGVLCEVVQPTRVATSVAFSLAGDLRLG